METTNLTDLPFDIHSSGISQVNAILYKKFSDKLTFIEDYELVNTNNIYQGHFNNLTVGEYVVTIEVKNVDDCIEIVRNATTFNIELVELESTSLVTSLKSQTNSSKSSAGLSYLSSLGLILYLIIYLKKRDKRNLD